MSRFEIGATPLSGLKTVRRMRLADERGFLSRIFCNEALAAAGWSTPIAQINHTLTRKHGAVRGMHYQLSPHSEIKLVSCLRGVVWDVAVDLRQGSPTFMHWHAEMLSAENQTALLIPQCFAHGFQAMSDDCELLYLHSSAYAPMAERGLNPLDPALAIAWPLDIAELSARDKQHPMLNKEFTGIKL